MQRNEVLTLLALPVKKVLTLKALLVQRNGQNNEVLRLLALLVQNVQILTLKALLVQRNERNDERNVHFGVMAWNAYKTGVSICTFVPVKQVN
jgi:hypothetical protein